MKKILKITLGVLFTFFIASTQPFVTFAQASPTDCGAYSSDDANNNTVDRCIEDKFRSCSPAFLHDNFMGKYRYDILGKIDDESGCRVKFTYILAQAESMTGKSMECKTNINARFYNIQMDKCAGALNDAFHKLGSEASGEIIDAFEDITIDGKERQTTEPALETGYFYKLSFFDDLLKKSEYLKYIPSRMRKIGPTQDVYVYLKPKGGVAFLVKGQEKYFLQEVSNPYRKELQTLLLADTSVKGKDTDGDGLPDDIEKYLGTHPKKKDSDRDGFDDRLELITGYDPLKKNTKLLRKDNGLNGKIYKQGALYWYVDALFAERYPLRNGDDIIRLAEEKLTSSLFSSHLSISATDSIFIDALTKKK